MRSGLLLLLLLPLAAQNPAEPPKTEGAKPRRPMGPPKNLQLLSPDNLLPTMQAFRAALGVQCNFCHVQGDFASDEKGHKKIARTMITMTRDINKNFEGDQAKVTCYTCHRGEEHPATAATAAPSNGQSSELPPKRTEIPHAEPPK